MDANTIVVGGGIVGLWTAYHLASEGIKTILLEQFPYPHTRGSSHGQSRVARTSYADDVYSNLMPEAHRRWKDLENYAGEQLLVRSGLVTLYDMGDSGDDFYSTLHNLKENAVEHHIVNVDDWKKKFPGFAILPEEKGIFESEAGILRADKCLIALQNWYRKVGGELHDGEQVISLNPINDSKIDVKTSLKTYSCKSVVLTCGAYINQLLSTLNYRIPVQPRKTFACYWKCKDYGQYSLKNGFPTIQIHGKHLCSMPSYEYPGLIKILSDEGPNIDPCSRDVINQDTERTKNEIFSRLKKQISQRFTDVDASSPAIIESCLYTESPDMKYILDFHPNHKNIVIGTGFSGFGFKTSPSVGRILASMALGKPSPYSVKPFSLRRSAKQ